MRNQQSNLPPKVSAADFREAIEQFRRITGPNWVFTDRESELLPYHDYFSPVNTDLHSPSAAVAPQSIEEIRQILAVCRQYRIPLWTFSTGRALTYGGPSPVLTGTVSLDLKRMNRILEVNEKHCYAVVEPGVSYMDLYRHLRQAGSRLWVDPAAPAWGSVLGNAMDRGIGLTPYGDHFGNTCGLQVVLADGEVIDTGMGAIPGSKALRCLRYGRGPWLDGMFTQSNLGIVTKLGMWLMPAPPSSKVVKVTFQNESDLPEIVNISHALKSEHIMPAVMRLDGLTKEAGFIGPKSFFHPGKGLLPDSVRERIKRDYDIGAWNLYTVFYGPEQATEVNWRLIKERFSDIRGVRFTTAEASPNDVSLAYTAKLMRGIPNMTEFTLLNWVPNGAHVSFAPVSPVNGDDALAQYHMAKRLMERHGFNDRSTFAVANSAMIHVCNIVFDRTDEEEKHRAHEAFSEMIREFTARGYAEYRTHVEFMDTIAKTFDWNGSSLWKAHERLKQALDPWGVLSPGKSGIWPAHLRELRK